MNHPVSLKILDQHTIALGKTGAGKSFALRGLVESLLDDNRRVCVVTPKGDWWGLKSSANGKAPGYPVVIFGGDHADVPINPRVGKEVAELVATGNRPSVIEFQGWMPTDRTRFWIDFSSTLFRLNRSPLWLVIDEVHNFAPQGKVLDPDAGKALHWTNRIASEGRGIGIRLLMASQRPQKVHKDTVTSAETLIAMRVIHKLDRDAMKDWIDGCGDQERGKMVMNSLAEMKRGEAFVWSPEIGFFERLKFPPIKTFDSMAAPTGSGNTATPKGWASVNLDEVKSRLASALEEAKANDPELLKKRIRELERGKPKQVDESVVTRAMERGRQEGERSAVARVKALEAIVLRHQQLMKRTAEALAKESGVKVDVAPRIILPQPQPLQLQQRVRRTDPAPVREGEISIRLGARRILAALVQWSPNGMTEGQMRSHAGLKNSGTYSAYKTDLRASGLIEEKGGQFFATQAGIDWLGHDIPSPSTTKDVLDVWMPKLRSGARRILDVLVANGGEEMTDAELQEACGLSNSGTFSAYKTDLRTAQLIVTGRGTVAANKETLFL